MVGRSSGDERRRERDRVMVQEGLELLKRKKEEQWYQKLKEQRELREMLNKYSPWGKPGCGAPNPDSIRKKNLQMEGLFPEKDKKTSAVSLGRPGGGAPRRTDSGQLNAQFRSDPMLRFQNDSQVRRCVDNVLRYRTDASEQKSYKMQLDQLVQEKSRMKNEVARREADYEQRLGWTDETTFKCLTNQNYSGYQNGADQVCGGVELVPLLARRRTAATGERHPLTSTDVTKVKNDPRRLSVQPELGREYTHELSRQILTKQQQLQEARRADAESSRRHFETWQQLWGRPGHGAPRDVKAKGNLDALLHRLVVK